MIHFKQLITNLIFIILIGINVEMKAQTPVFKYELRNDTLISPTQYKFDIYLLAANTGDFSLYQCQAGIIYNGTEIKNGGTISGAIVSGSSQFPSGYQPTVNLGTANCIKILTTGAPEGSNIISNVFPGTRLCTVKLTNTQPFTPGKKINLSWCFKTSPYPTKVFAWISGSSSLVLGLGMSDTTWCTKNNLVNPYFNSWNGFVDINWSNKDNWCPKGIPANNANVYIPLVTNYPHITVPDSTTQCQNLTIATGGKLYIDAGKALTVNGTTTLTDAECLIIKSSATAIGSFKDNGFAATSGTAKVERWVSTNGNSRWEYVSSPVTSASSAVFTSSSHALYYANEPTNAYLSYTVDSINAKMKIMRGYTRKYVNTESDGDKAVSFSGKLNSGTDSIMLTGTTINSTFNGWNLVGNPYPSTIDWDAASGWTKTGVGISVYFRSNGTFYTYNGGLGTGDATRYIPPMQAFWVRVTSGQTSGKLKCTNNVRVHNTHNIYKSAPFNNTLHMTLSKISNGLTDDTYIRFNPDATDGFDYQYDAYKMFAIDTAYPQVYTNNGLDDIAINNLSELIGERVIPLGFKTTASGQFTFTADMVSSFTDNGNTVYLKDLITGTFQNLSLNNTYQFYSDATSGLNRFTIHFNPSITNIKQDVKNQIQIYASSNEIHIDALDMLDGDVSVYDILGQVIATKHLSGSTSGIIALEDNDAIYVVKYTTGSQTIIKKIFINR